MFVDASTDGAEMTYTSPNVSDNSGHVVVNCSHSMGDVLPIGINHILYTARDPYHNQNNCTFEVHVEGKDNMQFVFFEYFFKNNSPK